MMTLNSYRSQLYYVKLSIAMSEIWGPFTSTYVTQLNCHIEGWPLTVRPVFEDCVSLSPQTFCPIFMI